MGDGSESHYMAICYLAAVVHVEYKDALHISVTAR